MESNPYATPKADLQSGDIVGPDAKLMTERVVSDTKVTARWATLATFMGFILAGLMALGLFASAQEEKTTRSHMAGPTTSAADASQLGEWIAQLFMIVFPILIAIAALRMAAALGRALRTREDDHFVAAAKIELGTFRVVGILAFAFSLIVLLLVIVMTVHGGMAG